MTWYIREQAYVVSLDMSEAPNLNEIKKWRGQRICVPCTRTASALHRNLQTSLVLPLKQLFPFIPLRLKHCAIY